MIKVNLQGLSTIDNTLEVINTPYGYALAEKNIRDHYNRRIIGFLDPTTTTTRDISALGVDIIPRPTSAITMEVIGAASDTAAGAGAQLVEVHGLNDSWRDISEVITMNGAAAVACINSYLRINNMHVIRVGANGVATGPIDFRASAGGTVYGRIAAGINTMEQCHFTVPSGKVAFITGWSAGATGKETRLYLRATVHWENRQLSPVFSTQDIFAQEASTTYKEFPIPIRMPPMCDIKVSATAKVAGGTAAASIELWYEDEDKEERSIQY